jgi:predicted RNA-binding Zn ribbon-like protein
MCNFHGLIIALYFQIVTPYNGVMLKKNSNTQKPWFERMLFVSGRISLDLAHTGGKGAAKAFERLHTPESLATWFAESDLQLHEVKVNQSDLSLAYDLREAIWNIANDIREENTVETKYVEIINDIAAYPTLIPSLSLDGKNQDWVVPIKAKSILSMIARDAIKLFADKKIQIQQCSNPTCPLLFVATSRPKKRRWCSMERCGNLTKVSRYRKKDR